ncbi:gag-proteinase polyprotein [Cucumis melo var. makuwa]|uniref:Gag-proteinase polyprotein n=1 Tax=Cucumis melo var. makuwa TaxID=1194695 RepID=A0A5A7U4G8_CUCMM|nr:gag-proteinase polyprotein [Cucumis melo var. makuwa]TYK06404.1 gag-proteinase polyprotein [Cucumis melo var. makuwa]
MFDNNLHRNEIRILLIQVGCCRNRPIMQVKAEVQRCTAVFAIDSVCEGTSTTRSHMLDEANYAYWKARMIAFLNSMDNRCWKSTKEEDEESLENTRALNALFNGVDWNVFKLINTCTSAKEAWNILEVAYEGTSKVKVSRLQILTSRFEALKMNDDETIAKFNVRVLDLANESFTLGEKIAKSKMVQKVLRSLPSRFSMKMTAIEEANDITTMKLDELFGSLRV